ncbi:hypothetical protein BOX15_Mlig012803g1 [Macrostomum lignano]|uniref:RING-type domain-containing protein n=1 Tax=Macrostomum lignano TaxID=282301 RepID=A0A267GUN7_9PLAT|nr:hypothetical protein BOX15_Mlig012803g1 [Macrostomum lignano]
MSHLPAGIPIEKSNMKYEVNRLSSFNLSGKQVKFKTGQKPETLAANGFFYLQEVDRVKCAFCLGTLFNWDPNEDVAEAHRLRFATCPMLLSLDVGNVPIQKPEDAKVRLSTQCTEAEVVPVAATAESDSQPASTAAIAAENLSAIAAPLQQADSELEREAQLSRRPRPPVSSATAAAACSPTAAGNLELLARSLQIAAGSGKAATYHPMCHPAWRDRRCRQEALARLSGSVRPVPADQLADAGFFPLAGQPLGSTACHWCGLRVLHWAGEDDPWVEHARWSPRCCHLLLERGHAFVLYSRARHPPYTLQPLPAASETAPIAADPSAPSATASLVDYRIEPRFFKAREDFPPALGLLQLGCDPDDAKTAQFLQLKTAGDDFQSSELFLESTLTQLRQRHSQGLSGREFFERAQRDQSLISNREPKPLGDEELDWRACKVCMDSIINVTLLNCNHLCCCSRCAKNLDTCPLCRSPISAIMLVNMD